MAMNTNLMIASGLSAVSVVLLLGLIAVWVRNYRTFRTPLTLGLIAFAAVLLVENLLAVYFFFSTGMLYSGDPIAQRALLSLRALQLFALAVLTYVTMQ
ncbi:hypothetical protein [Natronomonas marina]|jgi:hypothetical protein|uniref:hypothetical protein n=1 Tax=Natronomonas marina TaxID=2961939 RepID=UPI0020CA1F19|nr:hypothetical protein [Natronomonas marina]